MRGGRHRQLAHLSTQQREGVCILPLLLLEGGEALSTSSDLSLDVDHGVDERLHHRHRLVVAVEEVALRVAEREPTLLRLGVVVRLRTDLAAQVCQVALLADQLPLRLGHCRLELLGRALEGVKREEDLLHVVCILLGGCVDSAQLQRLLVRVGRHLLAQPF